ncbi:MAG: TRADD-N-associated membrane domain-containing protein [Almyronema sp.]
MARSLITTAYLKQQPLADTRITLLHQVIAEGIRQSQQNANQAHWSFVIATFMSTASALIGLSGAGLLLFGQASEGSVTTAVGLASGVYSYQLSKEAAERQKQANDRLEQLLLELKIETPQP